MLHANGGHMAGKGFAVSVIGTGREPGSFGWQVSEHLLGMNGLEKLILLARPSKKGKVSAELLKDFLYERFRRDAERKVEVKGYDGVLASDIAIIAVDQSNYRDIISKGQTFDRKLAFEPNLEAIREVAHSLQGYQGHAIIVTNPTDIMAALFRVISGVQNVQGFNHVDSYRLRRICCDRSGKQYGTTWLPEETQGFVVGPHSNEMVPLFSTLKFPGNLSFAYSPLRNYSDEIEQELKKRGGELIQDIKTSSTEMGRPIAEVVEAIIYGDRTVEASVYFKLSENQWMIPDVHDRKFMDNDMGTFMGLPVQFKNGVTTIERIELNEDEQERFVESYETTRSALESVVEKELKKKVFDLSTANYVPSDRVVAAGYNQIAELLDGKLKVHTCGRMIRSANVVSYNGKDYIALGLAKGGSDAVELREAADLSRPQRTFKLKDADIHEFGFNSVASIDDVLCASHSRFGIFTWNFEKPGEGTLAFGGEGTHRVVDFTLDGKPCFVSASDGLYAHDRDFKGKARKLFGRKPQCVAIHDGDLYTVADKVIYRIDGRGNVYDVGSTTRDAPDAMHVDIVRGDRYLFIGSKPNLTVKNLDTDEDRWFLRHPGFDTIDGITHYPGRIFAVAGKQIHEFETATMTHRKSYTLEQPLLSIVRVKEHGR